MSFVGSRCANSFHDLRSLKIEVRMNQAIFEAAEGGGRLGGPITDEDGDAYAGRSANESKTGGPRKLGAEQNERERPHRWLVPLPRPDTHLQQYTCAVANRECLLHTLIFMIVCRSTTTQ